LLLATAIEQRSSCEADVAACKAALARASEMVRQAEIRVETAKSAQETAKASITARMTAAAASGAPLTPDLAMREARAELIDATDSVEAAVAAIAVVEASASEAEAGLRRASSKVDDAGQERGEDV
jgi:hypothetical protein